MSPIKYRWYWTLKASKNRVWEILSSSRHVLHTLKLAQKAKRYSYIQSGQKKSQGGGKGILSTVFPEPELISCDWTQKSMVALQLKSTSGMLNHIELRFFIDESIDGCKVTAVATAHAGSIWAKFAVPFAIGKKLKKRVENLLLSISDIPENDMDPENKQSLQIEASFLPVSVQDRLNQSAEDLVKQGYRESWVAQFVQLLSFGSDADVREIRPNQLANRWGIPTRSILNLCLSACRMQLLSMRWQVSCPQCHDPKIVKTSLRSIARRASCQACQIHFTNNFSTTLSLFFQPHKRIRDLSQSKKNVTDPSSLPSAIIQQSVRPGGTVTVSRKLALGTYQVRVAGLGVKYIKPLKALRRVPSELNIEIGKNDLSIQSIREESDITQVHIRNSTDVEQAIIIEEPTENSLQITGTDILCCQHFRDLFPQESLHPSQPINSGTLYLIAIDIIESTRIYQRKGDEATYFLIREYYSFVRQILQRYDGGVNHASGDNLLLVFNDPTKAVRALIALEKEFDTFNNTLADGEQIEMRAALHSGECQVVGSNGVLSLQGNLVNYVWILQHLPKNHAIIISDEMLKLPDVEGILATEEFEAVETTESLRGQEKPCVYHYLHPKEKDDEEDDLLADG